METLPQSTENEHTSSELDSAADLARAAEKLTTDDRLRLMAELWASIPPWHQASATPSELAELRRNLDDYDAGRLDHFPWAIVRILMADNKPPSAAWKVYSVPRRFDLSTIFVVTLAYSLLFGAMKGVSLPAIASASIAGFITLVAAAQALLFRGAKPRTASILVGAVTYTVAVLAIWIITGQRMYGTTQILFMTSLTLIGGSILGYVAGGLVGAVFLIADKLRSFFSRKRRDDGEQDFTSNRPQPDAPARAPAVVATPASE
jgi:putative addiction module component (TIGR02574 family)